MALSRCCRKIVHTHYANDYGDYYVCGRCHCECDIILMKESEHKEYEDAEV